jgi:lysophospholipase L1-like esterase
MIGRELRPTISVIFFSIAFVCGLTVAQWQPVVGRVVLGTASAQEGPVETAGAYYRSKLSLFQHLPGRADVVMLGDSITEGVDWQELFPSFKVLNRGIGGDTTEGVLKRLYEIINREPQQVFLMIGINDLLLGSVVSKAEANIRSTIASLRRQKIRVVVQSTLYVTANSTMKVNDRVAELNRSMTDLCVSKEVLCVDLNAILAGGGALSPKFSLDGLHLNAAGYLAWKSQIDAYFSDLLHTSCSSSMVSAPGTNNCSDAVR